MRTATTIRSMRTSIQRRHRAAELAEQRLERHQAQATLHARWL